MIQVAMLLLNAFMLVVAILGLMVLSPYAVQGILICAAIFNRMQLFFGQSSSDKKTALRMLAIVGNMMLIFWGIYDVTSGIGEKSTLDVVFGVVVIVIGGLFLRSARSPDAS